jgi:hypothetical protein
MDMVKGQIYRTRNGCTARYTGYKVDRNWNEKRYCMIVENINGCRERPGRGEGQEFYVDNNGRFVPTGGAESWPGLDLV